MDVDGSSVMSLINGQNFEEKPAFIQIITNWLTTKSSSDINLIGIRHKGFKYFRAKNNGHISIVSSVAGYRGLPAASGYCASKAALTSLAESLYFDFKRHNVRVSLVSPGFIKTPLTDKNEFPMPMIKSAEYAAEKMFVGLTKKNAFEIHFPVAFTTIMKLLKIMPNWIYFLIVGKGLKIIKY